MTCECFAPARRFGLFAIPRPCLVVVVLLAIHKQNAHNQSKDATNQAADLVADSNKPALLEP